MKLYDIRTLAASGGDICEHLAALKGDPSPLATAALMFYFAYRGQSANVATLLAHKDSRARWGSIRALSEHFFPAHTDDLARALIDPDRRIRQQAFEGLERARKVGERIRPTRECLNALIANDSAIIRELLYLWSHADHAIAAEVASRSNNAMLKSLCSAIVRGELPPPCAICSKIEDFEVAGQIEKLPTKDLLSDGEDFLRCPSCGRRYHLFWAEQYTDEFGEHGTWDLFRLAPPVDSRSEDELRIGLEHPVRRTQRECSAVLAKKALSELRFAAVAELLASPQRDVRSTTIALLTSAPEFPVPPLERLLNDDDDDIRRLGSVALTHQLIRANDISAIEHVLTRPDRMTRSGALSTIEHASFDPSPLRATLVALAKDPDDFLHGPSRRILAKLNGG